MHRRFLFCFFNLALMHSCNDPYIDVLVHLNELMFCLSKIPFNVPLKCKVGRGIKTIRAGCKKLS